MDDVFSLEGRVALVTGASRGLGRATALELARAGADVAVVARSEAVKQTGQEIQSLGRQTRVVQADIGDPRALENLVAQTCEALGPIDILVNNAGIIIRTPATDYPLEDWEKVLHLNLTTAWRLSQMVGRIMVSRGQGKIINIASIMSFIGGVSIPAYAASKGGLAQLTKALANEWAGHGVNVNAVAPGYIETEMTKPLLADPERHRQLMDRIPAQRYGQPEDVARAVLFLATAAADYIHGHLLVVDGGWMAR